MSCKHRHSCVHYRKLKKIQIYQKGNITNEQRTKITARSLNHSASDHHIKSAYFYTQSRFREFSQHNGLHFIEILYHLFLEMAT